MVTVSAYAMLGYFVEQRERPASPLEAEQATSERLLLNVLPAPDRRASQDAATARSRSTTTPSPSSSPTSSASPPDPGHARRRARRAPRPHLLGLRPRGRRAQVEKIKTIGDAYMVAAVCPSAARPRCTRRPLRSRCARIAPIARAPVATLAVRIGVDTGPSSRRHRRRKFIYDLWATPSTREPHGVHGCRDPSAASPLHSRPLASAISSAPWPSAPRRRARAAPRPRASVSPPRR